MISSGQGAVVVGRPLVVLCWAVTQVCAQAADLGADKGKPLPVPAVVAAPAMGAAPALGAWAHTNPFDGERKLWPDRVPPPPPPPVPAPVTDDDLQLYGVVMAGGVRKALFKPGKRFAALVAGPTGVVAVPLGARVGEFVLSELTPDRVLLRAPGGEQWLGFTAKKDRGVRLAGGVQGPGSAPVPAFATAQSTGTEGFVQAQPVATAGGADGFAATPGGAPGVAAVAPVAPVQQSGVAATAFVPPENPPPAPMGSLAAAIAAARASQAAQPGAAPPVGAALGANPFQSLFQPSQTGR